MDVIIITLILCVNVCVFFSSGGGSMSYMLSIDNDARAHTHVNREWIIKMEIISTSDTCE